MPMRRLPAVLLLALGLVAALARAAPAQDARALAGWWTVESAQRDGRAAADLKGHRLEIQGNAFRIEGNGRTLYAGTFAVSPAHKPPRIDFRHTAGAAKGQTWRGIYHLRGATLEICDNAADLRAPRPTTFTTAPGSGRVFLVFKREKR